MALTTIAVNGVALEDYGLLPMALERWLAPPAVTYGAVDLVNRIGAVPTTRGIKYAPRELVLGVVTTAATISLSRAQLLAWYSACQGLLEIEVIDSPGKVCYGVFENAADDVTGIKLLSPMLTAVGKITCHDPLWYDRSPVSVSAAAATRVAVPVGTAPGIVVITVMGAATNPTVTLRSRTGASLGQMRFTVTLGATEALVIDARATWPVTKWTAGVLTDAFATLNVADVLLTVDPNDAPTLETSVGTLMVTAWRGDLV